MGYTWDDLYMEIGSLEDYVRGLEQENAKLKAREANTRLGLDKLGKIITSKNHYLAYQEGEFCIFR